MNDKVAASSCKGAVLIMDDDRDVRGVFRAFLENKGYVISEAENGRLGLELFEELRPDAILVDLYMREVNGLDVLRRIRESSPDTPCIVISGTGRICDAVEALHLGAWDIILKPIVDFNVILSSVDKCLTRSRIQREIKVLRQNNLDLLGFQSFVAKVPNIAIQGYSADRRAVFWNRASETLYGYSQGDVLGKRMEELILPERTKENAIIQFTTFTNALEESRDLKEQQVMDRDGREFTVLTNWTLHQTEHQITVFRADVSGI